jgi:hypothetical protein
MAYRLKSQPASRHPTRRLDKQALLLVVVRTRRRDVREVEVSEMGRVVVGFLFAGLIALLSAPLFAGPTVSDDAPGTGATVAVQRVSIPGTGLRDEAAMVLVGTALIGLAAAVRRAA